MSFLTLKVYHVLLVDKDAAVNIITIRTPSSWLKIDLEKKFCCLDKNYRYYSVLDDDNCFLPY